MFYLGLELGYSGCQSGCSTRQILEKFYILKRKMFYLGLELGYSGCQSGCSTTQATVPHTDYG